MITELNNYSKKATTELIKKNQSNDQRTNITMQHSGQQLVKAIYTQGRK